MTWLAAPRRPALLAGVAVLGAGLASLFAGMMMPGGVIVTGKLNPADWLSPALAGGLALLIGAHQAHIRVPLAGALAAVMALIAPPLMLCLAGSAGQERRMAAWLAWGADSLPPTSAHLHVAILSGPQLFAPDRGPEFGAAPLWQALSQRLALQPVDTPVGGAMHHAKTLLLVQPRALAPAEVLALDRWVRDGGRAVVLADPDLRWPDPAAGASRPPRASLLGPLLDRWGVVLKPAPSPVPGAAPVERRFLDDGSLLRTAGTSSWGLKGGDCALSAAALVARCRIGRGTAVLVADADFAHESLWTANAAAPGRPSRWTSDAVTILMGWLGDDLGQAGKGRIWLARADGLAAALRPALAILALAACLAGFLFSTSRTKTESIRESPVRSP